MNVPDRMNYIEITEPGGPEVLKLMQADVPTPGDHELLIRVHAAGINRPDVIQRSLGFAGRSPERSPPRGN